MTISAGGAEKVARIARRMRWGRALSGEKTAFYIAPETPPTSPYPLLPQGRRGCFNGPEPSYFPKPSTSCIEYRPDGLPRAHSAARTAPAAKTWRPDALCPSSTRSPSAAKITV